MCYISLSIALFLMKIYDIISAPRSYRAIDKVYGLVTSIPLLAYLEHEGKSSGAAIVFILVTLFSIWLAESYSGFYKAVYKTKKHLSGSKILEIMKREFAVMLSANLLFVPFLLQMAGLISLETAYQLAQFIGILLLFRVGFRLSLHIDQSLFRALKYGAVSASFGIIVVLIKSLVH